ncbi:transcription initiation factor IIF subunit alpha [Ricinus communis]|uniref:Transcription initiation factor IIF subunit alpha n=1 Tax=Ricinus communis TaxID=3988 RepID=B9S068_RICCO|nr:transcription initiation factor IIF subunit alpha [Ricinus communis]EEF43004.1 tfiif-alpha, putative [Ricinus communis]|eukprot:XP_002519387.1 transcription initiation factor IIF subunit alpha [Ricinus communis]
MATMDLMLKGSCSGCGSTTDLYGSNCKHMTLCLSCGKTMAENHAKCFDCGATVSRLIREYNVRASSSSDKNYFIGRFVTGLPSFSKKKNAENKWSLQKEGLQGRQLTDALREKYKNRPWLLEDETGQFQYQGHLEGSQSATYYLLILQGKEFVAIPASSWYNFNKVAQYKQLTLEEAEEKMRNRRKTADGYERWMMKAANNGPAAFGEVEKLDDKDSGAASGRGRKKAAGDDEEGNVSDRGDEDEEEEAARKNRLGLNKRGGDDDEEGPRGGDHDIDDDDIEKGDDWEHEEIFTDDDEAVGNDREEREDLAPEVPAPPEIKQDEDDEDEENEEGGLSKSGKELKKLLGRAGGLNDSDAEDDDDDDDMDEDVSISPVLAPKQTPKEEPADNSPAKPMTSASSKGTPSTSKSAKGKRKLNSDEAKQTNVAPQKKVKTENELKPTVKEESAPTSKSSATPKAAPPSAKTGSTSPVTEEEIRAVLLQNGPVTTQDLVARFKSRLKSSEDKKAFADILRRISKIQKTSGSSYVVLRDK